LASINQIKLSFYHKLKGDYAMNKVKKSIVLVCISLSIFLSSCGRGWQESYSNPIQQTSEGIRYEIFYVEGMPCMRFGGRISEQGTSCDWSRWNGNK
jgi:hypothetical protein